MTESAPRTRPSSSLSIVTHTAALNNSSRNSISGPPKNHIMVLEAEETRDGLKGKPRPDADIEPRWEELKDARRLVGEEEDRDDLKEVKQALRKVLAVADTLSETLSSLRSKQTEQESTIQSLREAQSDMETTLTLAKSNLTLERANNEMLEEALKRAGGASAGKDVGWKRYSEREASTLLKRGLAATSAAMTRPNTTLTRAISELEPASMEGRRRSFSTGSHHRTETTGNAVQDSDGGPLSSSPTEVVPPRSVPERPESSRFFKFRFGGTSTGSTGAKTPGSANRSPVSAGTHPPVIAVGGTSPIHLTTASLPAHLTSSSMPSLLPNNNASITPANSRPASPAPPPPPPLITPEELFILRASHQNTTLELQSLRQTHEKLQKAHTALQSSHKTLVEEKAALESELESLSQALFEEANKMVADERKRCAMFEEELRVCRAQRDALKGALKVIEAENSELRGEVRAPDGSHDQQESSGVNGAHEHHEPQDQDQDTDFRTPPLSPSSSVHAVKSPRTSVEDGRDRSNGRPSDLERQRTSVDNPPALALVQ